MSFLSELKRRNVYRVAAVYIIVGWIVLQVVDVFTEFMPLPEWTARLVFVLLAAGFPVALVLAWAMELTPEGLRLEVPAPGGVSRGRRGDRLLMGGLALIVLVAGWNVLAERAGPDAGFLPVESIVVLPLDNLVDDPSKSFWVEGMHEALITELSKIEDLRVISRTSAMKYRESNLSVPEIGEELGVDAVVEGSVFRTGETVRVTAQLIDARTDRHLWADNFDREVTDILALYADVTREIAREIQLQVSPEQAASLAEAPTVDPEGYELYLEGMVLCEKWGPREMARGIDLMRRAVELEPDYAPAQAGLAICLQYAAFFDYVRSLEVVDEAGRAARRAVELDPKLAEGWVAVAAVRYYMEFDHVASELALDRALSLNPSNVRALTHLSWQLGEAGRIAEALEVARRARELDPFSPGTGTSLGQAYFLGRDFAAAYAAYRELVELDPSDPSLRYYAGWCLEQLGRFPEAVEAHRTAVELSGSAPLYRSGLGYALGLAGRTEEAREVLDGLTGDPEADPFHLAMVQIPLGLHDEALGNLEAAYRERTAYMLYLKEGAHFDPLRSEPEFQRLLGLIGW